ncbi:MAG: hypothetical protein ABIK92_04610 [Pseudomonadota bacterium]
MDKQILEAIEELMKNQGAMMKVQLALLEKIDRLNEAIAYMAGKSN